MRITSRFISYTHCCEGRLEKKYFLGAKCWLFTVLRNTIVESLMQEGAKSVQWLTISKSRSLFDKIDVEKYIGDIDFALYYKRLIS